MKMDKSFESRGGGWSLDQPASLLNLVNKPVIQNPLLIPKPLHKLWVGPSLLRSISHFIPLP